MRSKDESAIRRASALAIAALAILNIVDVVTTHRLLAHGAGETNPLTSALLTSNNLTLVKLGITGLLGLCVLFFRPRLGVMAAMWFVTGIYAAAVLSNMLLLKLV